MTISLSRKRPVKPPARALARRFGVTGLAAVGATVAMAAAAAAPGFAAAAPDRFKVTNLVSDVPGLAPTLDSSLVNPWGTSEFDTSLWVSNQGAGTATSYFASETLLIASALKVSIPNQQPTGQVVNTDAGTPGDFVVKSGNQAGPAQLIFANKAGQISGFNLGVGDSATAVATRALETASVSGATFTGLAISGSTLYAADFRQGAIDLFNSSWQQVSRPGAFTDFRIPRAFKPFNVQNLGGSIYVTYARPDRTGNPGHVLGAGFVDVYSPQGALQKRLISGGLLDSPWGLAIAPPQFGRFSNDLLVGNNGDGVINAYSLRTGRFLGALRDSRGGLVHENGLWSLTLGHEVTGGEQTLLFTAGIDNQTHGLIGAITPAS